MNGCLAIASNDEIGELSRWFNTFLQSLASKQQVETALRESEERYSLALQGAKDGIWDWDLRTQTIHYSPRWHTMLGYQENTLGNSPQAWFERIHPEDVAQVTNDLQTHLDGQTSHFESEHRLLQGNGKTYCWVLARGLAIRDAEHRATRLAGSLTDISVRKTIEEHLRYDALHDGLTHLPNRTYFMKRLQQVLDQVEQIEGNSAVISLDLDRFKIINDSLGHPAGDQLLIQISQRLRSCLRSGDMVARFGGDEFAVLLINMPDSNYVVTLADRLQHALKAPICLQGHEVSVSASLGITRITPKYRQPDDLLRDADTALYQAKALGKACYAIFDNVMHERTLELLKLEGHLRRALEREEFCVFYQPIFSLKTWEITAVEALIRWMSPELGMVSPAEFIPLAEETGLIEPIGEWVLRTACQQVKRWHDQGFPNLKVSVNLSARQMKGESLPNLIRSVLLETGLPAQCLQLEITESVAMADVSLTHDLLETLQNMGVQIAIDDFGTSYSSLGYLKRFPVSGIKIDRSFISDVGRTEDADAIASAIIAMAHILGLRVTAEGVETAEQLAFLQQHQCDTIQGFLISPALPAEQVLLADVVLPRALSVQSVS